MIQQNPDSNPHIDASTFQKPLGQLAEVLAQKMKREAPALLAAPGFVSIDIHVLIRQAICTYDLLFYINADERREQDCYWKPVYTIVTAPLVRNMIDCLYNITRILQSPNVNGPAFRKSGFRKRLEALAANERRYGEQSNWIDWIDRNRKEIDLAMRAHNLTMHEVRAQKPWPTLGKYINEKGQDGTLTPHQQFLETFTLGKWREYSAMAHGTFEGLMDVARY